MAIGVTCDMLPFTLQEAIISHGCSVKRSNISNAVVGLRSHVEEGCTIEVGRGQWGYHSCWCSVHIMHAVFGETPCLGGAVHRRANGSASAICAPGGMLVRLKH
jgi:hypothetical protein